MASESTLTIADLQVELPAQDYETLTLGDDTNATRALLKAKLAVKALIVSTGHAYDEDDNVCAMAVLKWALYELYSFVGEEGRAKEKREDAELLIETSFGAITRKSDAESGGAVVGSMKTFRLSPMEKPRR